MTDSEVKQLQDAVLANQDQLAQELCLNTLQLARRIRHKICLVRRASMATLLAEDWPLNVDIIEEECTQASNCFRFGSQLALAKLWRVCL